MSLTLMPKVFRANEDKQAELERELIRQEAEIGGKLFGDLPKGHVRQFFCLDDRTWIWHKQWFDQNGERQSMTTRYVVRPTGGVIRSQNGQAYQYLSSSEADNFYKATQLYGKKVDDYYGQLLSVA
jgi:hypothetical protein